MGKSKGASAESEGSGPKRAYLKQSDVPATSLDEALRVPQAILDHYAGSATSPLHLAKALNVDPGGSQFRVLTGAAIAYGLTEGGAQASAIEVTDLARSILRPKEEGADIAARRDAVLTPRVFGEFLRRYDSNQFPREDIAQNVLEEMGVPRGKAAEVVARMEETAESVGFLEEVRGKKYVTLAGTAESLQPHAPSFPTQETQAAADVDDQAASEPAAPAEPPPVKKTLTKPSTMGVAILDDERRRRVFITHGKNRDLVEPIKKLLEYGELEPVVAVERQSVSKPVPDKVMDEMRSCGAAIIHVDVDRTIVDCDGNDHVLLNPNVLIEIGAAMAVYGRRFILLVRDGVRLPSNLQGLFEVRYEGKTLDADATIRLLDAIKDIKNHALPGEPEEDES